MRGLARASFSWLAVVLALLLGQGIARAETRFALVIGNDEYKAGALATPANDAGLIANALQAAGFTVTGARNLDQATLRESVREFLAQVSAAGPDAVALVYLAGYGVQFSGENYFVPVDADLQRDTDVPLQAVRISDFTQPLAALPAGVKIVILDAARQNSFVTGDQPLAGGLALVEPVPNMALAFNAAPGTVGPPEQGPYGAYATALAEMISAGGLGLDDIFARVRLRVSELTNGAEVPWYVSQIGTQFLFTERTADAPPAPNVVPLADLRSKPMRDFPRVEDAYAAAVELDTMPGYEQFLAVYPNSPYSRRVAAMLAVRREEIVWRRSVTADTPPAYWSYLRRYPHGPHVWDARRRLTMLGAPVDPTAEFVAVDFGVPPPPPDELAFVDRPVLIFEGSGFGPPPPPPAFFLPQRPREFTVLAPPPRPTERFFLPAPAALPVLGFVRPPRSVVVRQPPLPLGAPADARPGFRVSLPGPVQSHLPPGASVAPGKPGGANEPLVLPSRQHREGVPIAPPSTPSALVKPPPAPPSPNPRVPTSIKPSTPPPPPRHAAPVMVKPTPPPPPQRAAPVMVRPPTPPTPPPQRAAPVTARPLPSQQLRPPVQPQGAAKPVACPPGKTAVNVGGHVVCR